MGLPTSRVVKQLSAQSAVHEVFGEVFEELGGRDFLLEWAKQNPTPFVKLLAGMSPGLMPTQGMQGDINITINNSLGKTPLDGHVMEGEFDAVQE